VRSWFGLFCQGSHSLIPAIFEGLIVICLFLRCTPRKLILVHSNLHFNGFKKYKCSSKMSRRLTPALGQHQCWRPCKFMEPAKSLYMTGT
jgi:hypothetical protein